MLKNTLLLFFLYVSFLAHSSSDYCSVPESLNGKSIVSASDQDFSPQNPFHGSIMQLKFHADGTYTNRIFTIDTTVLGEYEYKKVSKHVGIIKATEDFQGEVTDYTYVLNCLTDYKGTAVYTQATGAIEPELRQNTSTYIIQ